MHFDYMEHIPSLTQAGEFAVASLLELFFVRRPSDMAAYFVPGQKFHLLANIVRISRINRLTQATGTNGFSQLSIKGLSIYTIYLINKKEPLSSPIPPSSTSLFATTPFDSL